VSTKEKIDELLAGLKTRLEELREASLARIEEVRKDAAEEVDRYEEAAEALEGIEARLGMLRAEEESLPLDLSRAVLANDVDEEKRLKERFATVSREIEDLEDGQVSRKGELARIFSRSSGGPPPHPNDVLKRPYSKAAKAAAAERAELERLKKEAVKALDEAVASVAKQHNAYSGMAESLSMQRSQDRGQQEWLARLKARESATYQAQEEAREREVRSKRQRANAARVLASRGPRDDEE
jgi:septal ring factor EnvC (AmiA/AmiB activator)